MQQTREKMSPRDIGIIVGTLIALLVAGVVIFQFVTGDGPHPINPPPKNPGKSEKMMEMERAKQSGGTASPEGENARPSGDDVQPPARSN